MKMCRTRHASHQHPSYHLEFINERLNEIELYEDIHTRVV